MMIFPYQHQKRKKHRTAFTLIELLVVIAIISLLVSILIPSLTKAKELAKKTICQTQLRSHHNAFMFYADDNADLVLDCPMSSSNHSYYDGDWASYFAQYFEMKRRDYTPPAPSWGWSWTRSPVKNVFVCPSEENPTGHASYSLNFNLGGNFPDPRTSSDYVFWHRLSDENLHGAQCMRMGDTGDFYYIDVSLCRYSDSVRAERMMGKAHINGGNYLFCDGRVEWVPAELGIWHWRNSDYSLHLFGWN
jgi:prepilin-type N-terminal cleavage/methylation domain-containing protein/prepilin-type processing-associated H-X9-DG protein